MHPLNKPLRNQLEKTVKDARDQAETAARAALEQVGVGEPSPPAHLTEPERDLRRRLRIHGRQLGDVRQEDGNREIDRLLEEVAYEHWHRMLFARFLAENNLLMYLDPAGPIPVTLEECEDLAAAEGAAKGWEPAACIFEAWTEHRSELKTLKTWLREKFFKRQLFLMVPLVGKKGAGGLSG